MVRYALAIFLGAFLLFQVQPFMGKCILPWFGGGPAVWTTCMLFFQSALLAGYAYAHVLARRLGRRGQAVLHVSLLVTALFLLPVRPSGAWKPAGLADPTWHILALVAVSVGLPYFLLASTSPLLQAWFARTHPGRSPYRLYALSNAGSLLALLSYPFVVEPTLPLSTQSLVWSGGFVVFAALCAWCALRAAGAPAAVVESETPTEAGPAPRPLTWLLWLALPACASVLLLAVTNQLCLDVAAVPFLWVLPLSLYLLSFVLVFHRDWWYPRGVFAVALLLAMGGLVALIYKDVYADLGWQVFGYSGGLFVCCMVCHGELVRLRPAPSRLTAFYLMISAGGALGGVLVTLVAPRVFPDYFELHLGLLACLVLAAVAYWHNGGRRWPGLGWKLYPLAALSLAAPAALVVALWSPVADGLTGVDEIARNFYGVLRVTTYDEDEPDLTYTSLQHGRISHGCQFAAEHQRHLATTYYGAESGVGLALRELQSVSAIRVGVVGLGVGTLATYAEEGDHFTFYEINPEVVRLARSRFTFLGDCRAPVEIVPGDARLSLERQLPQGYHLLAVDAFNSDAIPVHLLTREAFALYLRHLRPEGVLAVHTSNRHLDLLPVVRAHAEHFGMVVAVIDSDEDDLDKIDLATWVLLSRDGSLIERGAIFDAAELDEEPPLRRCPWTDDFSNLFEVLD